MTFWKRPQSGHSIFPGLRLIRFSRFPFRRLFVGHRLMFSGRYLAKSQTLQAHSAFDWGIRSLEIHARPSKAISTGMPIVKAARSAIHIIPKVVTPSGMIAPVRGRNITLTFTKRQNLAKTLAFESNPDRTWLLCWVAYSINFCAYPS